MRWRALRRPDVVCQEAVQLFTDYLDDALSTKERSRLESHLATCPPCRRYLDQLRSTVATLGHLEPDDVPPPVMDELLEVFRRYRSDAGS
jgi:anti-sigma factor RsiW